MHSHLSHDGLLQRPADAAETYSLGKYLRYFGDGFESKSKSRKARASRVGLSIRIRLWTLWHIPVMDGEFIIEATGGVAKGVAGGNIILQASHRRPPWPRPNGPPAPWPS